MTRSILSRLCYLSIIWGAWLSPWLQTAVMAQSVRNILLEPGIQSMKSLSQNWDDAQAEWFYNVPQGSKLLPYVWYLHLEQADSTQAFNDSAHIRALGYLPRAADATNNSDGLPVGFTRDVSHLGLTCAACHTNEIHFNKTAYLIDGAPTLGDLEQFLVQLVNSLDKTLNDPAKFERFAKGVLGDPPSPAAVAKLKDDLSKELMRRRAYNDRNLPSGAAPHGGPGRLDAFGAIMNEVSETFAQMPGNRHPANAPVSYPFLWDAPLHDFVQWNGAAPNKSLFFLGPIVGTSKVGALARNVGEVLGVFGQVNTDNEGGLVQLRGYESSVNKANLIEIEETLTDLWSPQWPADFGVIDPDLRREGKRLFAKHCASCHDPNFERDDPNRFIEAQMSSVGTDPTMAANFAVRTAKSGVFEGRRRDIIGLTRLQAVEPVQHLLVHMVQRVVAWPQGDEVPPFDPIAILANAKNDFGYRVLADIKVGDGDVLSGDFESLEFIDGKVKQFASVTPLVMAANDKIFRQESIGTSKDAVFEAVDGALFRLNEMKGVESVVDRTVTLSEPASIAFKYKARPLNGIWATAPYLHNGSVPNLDELLKPAKDRIAKFKVGSREFDPDKVGFRSDVGTFEFDTSLPGNSSAGHEYKADHSDGVFTDLERRQLVEYMKSL